MWPVVRLQLLQLVVGVVEQDRSESETNADQQDDDDAEDQQILVARRLTIARTLARHIVHAAEARRELGAE